MAAGHKKPGSGKYPLACLDSGPPPTIHHDHYVWGTCGCELCATWKARLDVHTEASDRSSGHTRSCMCGLCKDKRASLIQSLVAENIRDLWSELSWIAQMDGWNKDWTEWLMEELAKRDRSVGWWASQCSHLSMSSWCGKYHKWHSIKAQSNAKDSA